MAREMVTQSEVRKWKTNIVGCLLDVESKIQHKWTYVQNGSRLRDPENRLVLAKGGGRGVEEVWGGSLQLADCKL